jgi:hypothetical protein
MIVAQRTTYQSITFRSRLESRWAYFLTRLGIAWEYEPCLVDLGSLRYLPDFRVAGAYWLEIKGHMANDQAGLTIVTKCERLAALTNLPVILAFYDPFAAKCAAFMPCGEMTQAHFGMCPECGGLAVKWEQCCLCPHPNPPLTLDTERIYRKLIFDAAVAARDEDVWSGSAEQ